jgi:hypothetical protein
MAKIPPSDCEDFSLYIIIPDQNPGIWVSYARGFNQSKVVIIFKSGIMIYKEKSSQSEGGILAIIINTLDL